jgi:hypothetical protein
VFNLLARAGRSNSTKTKVGFIIVGVMKGGTTSLWKYLAQHPEIGGPRQKELHFFDDEDLFSRSKANYAEYHRNFDFSSGHKIYGEATPIYIYWRDAVRRIWEYNPEMKIIALFRNPVARAYSHWKVKANKSKESHTFTEALRREALRARNTLPLQNKKFSYVDRGFYGDQIRQLRRYFEPRQLLFLKSEDFFRDPASTMPLVTDFLGVGSYQFDVSEVYAKSPDTEPMSEENKRYLLDLYTPEVRLVESLLQWDCSDWLK